jgi:hypothetical protein
MTFVDPSILFIFKKLFKQVDDTVYVLGLDSESHKQTSRQKFN